MTIAACGIAAVIRRHILCKRRRRGRKGEALGEQIQRIYRSFAALQKFNKKKCMQLSGGALCKAAWKEVSDIFGEDSAEAGKYRTEGML